MNLEDQIKQIVKNIYGLDVNPVVSRTDPEHGDYASNVAMQIAKQVGQNPREVATKICEYLGQNGYKTEVAGPGFINIWMGDDAVQKVVADILDAGDMYGCNDLYKGQEVIAEYSDPNPFKVLHAGHFYTSVVGDAIANLYQAAGANVHRVNFGGDVGMHAAKALYGIILNIEGENPEKLNKIPVDNRAVWISKCYVAGNDAYENDESKKAEIAAVNKKIYQLHADDDHGSNFAQIYWTCRQWSYDYFDAFYADIGTKFEKYYPESQTSPLGQAKVQELTVTGVLKESDGALVFVGEDYGLHTRVFQTAAGLPTYEAKDIGLILAKWRDYHFDKSVIITANDIKEYMKVVLKVVEQFDPHLSAATTHLTHGLVKLPGGAKMSSRKGNVLLARDLLDVAREAQMESQGMPAPQVELAAIKYAFLKQRVGGDIIFDPKESVSLQGNSGPYLQYAYARGMSIIRKAAEQPIGEYNYTLDNSERALVIKLSQYPEIILSSVIAHLPSTVCTYLYELTQEFNSFYEKNRVIGDDREPQRLTLLGAYNQVLKNGLGVLGITAPDKM